jgi:phosphomannomutase
MFLEPDGSLPNHGLDPLQPENRAELQQRIVKEGADVGFAFDGDGDRFFTIDDRGEFIPGDFMTALLAEYLLKRQPGEKIIYDVRASWAVADRVRAAGGTPLVERVGHAFIKRRMADENVLFAGEVSGHYYFRDFNFADSGLIPSLLILEMLSKSGKRLSELLAPLEAKYFVSGEINSTVSDSAVKMSQIEQRYAGGKVEHIDGISVSFDDWHFNVRSSNTEPLLRLNLEALSKELMEQKRDEVLALIHE